MPAASGNAGGRVVGAGDVKMPLVRSVERAVRILGSLLVAPEGRQLSDLSRELGLHKTTVLRLLRTLVASGMVAREAANDRYRWEPMSWLAAAFRLDHLRSQPQQVQEILRQLAQASGETAGLGIPDIFRRETPLVATALSGHPVQVDPRVSPSLPMHAVAAGKCYLAGLPPAELEAWMGQGLPAATPHTITSPQRLREELAQVRRQGYALSRQEGLLGACGLAVPVVNASGKVVAGLGLAVPLARFTERNIRRWLPLLRAAADQLGRRLYQLGQAAALSTEPSQVPEPIPFSRNRVARSETTLQDPYRLI